MALTALQRQVLAEVCDKGRTRVSEETRWALVAHGAVVESRYAVGDPLYPEDLTSEGREIGRVEAIRLAARRRRRNAAARGRADAARSIGLRRTPWGWE